MKYSFMSFSCPGASIEELIASAKKYGYDGVEPRTASGHGHGIEIEADSAARESAKEKFAASGVEISCIATSCKYSDPSTSDENVEDTKKYIDLAGDVGSPAVRVFGGLLPDGATRDEAVLNVAKSLHEVSAAAESRGVYVCFETHDDWCDPGHVAEVMKKVNHPFIRVNWDIMHPVRRAGRTIDESFEVLRPWISHVHFHDGVTLPDGKLEMVPIGEGDIDHKRAVELLQEDGYSGFLSGEWINWQPCDEHLPREIKTMRGFEKT